jgi:hypothetical protein
MHARQGHASNLFAFGTLVGEAFFFDPACFLEAALASNTRVQRRIIIPRGKF